ncbi:MAG: DUF885 domain-containing protein [Candidatus Omnitrophica bacterium]|nr:DUF885 domain-containing protein [Candidatus Omnitrophota bacterium]
MKKETCVSINKISEDYFGYMSRNYPVLCLSDEFYFFPRAKQALNFLHISDDLSREKIEQNTAYVRKLLAGLEKLDPGKMDLESQIDFTLLKQSISSYLREFDFIKTWRINPSLYLKIMLIGIEHLLLKAPYFENDINEKLLRKIAAAPCLIRQAKENLKNIPPAYLETGLAISGYAIKHLKNLPFGRFKPAVRKKLVAEAKKAVLALEDLRTFLKRKSPKDFSLNRKNLIIRILKDSFSYSKDLKGIFQSASSELDKTLNELKAAAERIDPAKNWQELLFRYRPEVKNTKELLRLYANQTRKIKNFLKKKNIMTVPPVQRILVCETPEYMRPIRASASYACPLSILKKEPAFFYITPSPSNSQKNWLSTIHHEYIFVTAHETYPGHHLLDSLRRNLKNPVRAQVESPLFYEGWASYSEALIYELGYTKQMPLQKLVGLKRQAWRAVRAMLDAGLAIKKIDLNEAARLLTGLGYASSTVRMMLKHYLLTPGYQLCYTVGKLEFEKLKNKFADRMGLKLFHDSLLSSGQIPFCLLDKKLESLLCPKK